MPVAFLSRLLRGSEMGLEEPELWVIAIRWAVSKFRYYLLGSECTVYVPEAYLVALFRAREVHPRIQVLLADMACYRVRFEVGEGAWAYS